MTEPLGSHKWFPASLEQQGFSIRKVFKESERYVTAEIFDGQQHFAFKQVLEPDSGKATGVEGFDFAQYLLVEAAVLKFLDLHQAGLAGTSPKLLDVKTGVKHAYYVRELVPYCSMAVPGSNFFFEDLPNLMTADKVAGYLCSMSDLADKLPEDLRSILLARRFVMTLPQLRVAIRQPLQVCPQLTPLHERILEIFAEWRPVRKAAPLVLVHGEPYPPHWYLSKGEVGLIDWENARLDDRYADLAAVYLRAFSWPAWQKQLLKSADVDQNHILWRGMLLYQALLNLPYLRLDESEPYELRQAALEYLQKLITTLVK